MGEQYTLKVVIDDSKIRELESRLNKLGGGSSGGSSGGSGGGGINGMLGKLGGGGGSSGMMKNMADISGNLMDMHKKKKEFHTNDKAPVAIEGGTTNNVFVGSTTELQRMLQDVNDEKIIDVSPTKE
mgnify:CR=1 FL=1